MKKRKRIWIAILLSVLAILVIVPYLYGLCLLHRVKYIAKNFDDSRYQIEFREVYYPDNDKVHAYKVRHINKKEMEALSEILSTTKFKSAYVNVLSFNFGINTLDISSKDNDKYSIEMYLGESSYEFYIAFGDMPKDELKLYLSFRFSSSEYERFRGMLFDTEKGTYL